MRMVSSVDMPLRCPGFAMVVDAYAYDDMFQRLMMLIIIYRCIDDDIYDDHMAVLRVCHADDRTAGLRWRMMIRNTCFPGCCFIAIKCRQPPSLILMR